MDRHGADAQPGDPAGLDAVWLHYRRMVEFARDGYVITDGRGVILSANYAAASAFQCSKEFLIGKPLGLYVTFGYRTRFYQSLGRLIEGSSYEELECRLGRGRVERAVCIQGARLEDEGKEGVTFRWIIHDVTEQRRAEAARDELVRRLVTAQEDERRRVARELHDSVGQLLSALILDLRAVRDSGPLTSAALARLEEAERLAHELGRSTHELAIRLRPTSLDDLGLVAALRQYLEDWSVRSGVQARYEAVGLASARLPAEVETTLYRVAQEALTNALKHAQARLVSVVLELQEGWAIAMIEDDGVGFDTDSVRGAEQLGLRGMRERVLLAGGTLQVESSPGTGTAVIARVPLA